MASYNWTEESMVQNVEKWYAISTPTEKVDGIAWYPISNLGARGIAERTGTPLLKSIGVIAALSPLMRWTKNVPLAEAIIVQYQNGEELRGHFSSNTDKARAILDSDGSVSAILDILLGVVGWKTANFFLNIAGIKAPEGYAHKLVGTLLGATIDRFIMGVVLDTYLGEALPSIGRKNYITTSNALRTVAARHGIRVEELQAIVWIAFRRYHNIKD